MNQSTGQIPNYILVIDLIHTVAIFLWHHAQGGKLKSTATFHIAMYVKVGNLNLF